ncbi:uncharacterized protein LOC133294174 [Gastrolobium bilobum]|uniref:uncharacterized protein LOC133294174 n=1 Tax=Gastrolobium bilobum TaxID=150636 RepID=UPI002AB26515|nr:uncharacterized protein LOC133294174 [Gastrolobium bilobum]
MLQTIGQFNGMPSEDPHLLLKKFMDVANTFKITGVTSDALKMKLFPYSLTNKAKAWLNSLQPQSIQSWEELADKFLLKFFPPMKAAQYRNDISTFKQLSICNTREDGNQQLSWPVERSSLTPKKATGVWELDVVTTLSTRISALNNSIKTMNLSAKAKAQPVNAITDAISCVFCNGPHVYDNCPQNPQSICFIGQHHRQHQGQQQMSSDTAGRSYKASYPPGFTQQHHQPRQQADTSISLESMLKDYMIMSDAIIYNQAASIKNLETQVGQLAEALRSRPQGTLPSNTEVPKKNGEEQVNAISLRSGKAKALNQNEEDKVAEEVENHDQPKEPQVADTENIAIAKPQQGQTVSKATRLPPAFPQRLQKQTDDKQYKKFLDVLKQLHINVPLVEALEQMPSNALLDLGSSINLMPKSIFRKLGIGEARPTTVALLMADRSITYPKGKIEDVLVRVDKFIFPADFIVLDFEADREVPIILGRAFLATGRAVIDVEK